PLFTPSLPGADAPQGMITGTVTYLQRVALAPDAVISVSLQDVTLAEGPSKLIIEQRFPAAGRQVPIAFRLPYDSASIDNSHRYSLRATITTRGKLNFTTTTTRRKLNFTPPATYPVLTGSGIRNVEMVLQAVGGPTKPATTTATRPSG